MKKWRTKAEDKKSENRTNHGPPEEKKRARNCRTG
jgi:hypothetical protein